MSTWPQCQRSDVLQLPTNLITSVRLNDDVTQASNLVREQTLNVWEYLFGFKIYIFTENQSYSTIKRTDKQGRERKGINKNVSRVTFCRVRVTTFAMKTHFLCIVAHVYVVVCRMKRLSVPTEMLQWVSFFFLVFSSYKVFRTAVNNIKVLSSLCKVPDFFPRFKKMNFLLKSPR